MIRLLHTLFPKSLVLAAAGAGMFVASVGDVSACDGKRGGFYRPTSYRPAYPTQYCQKPVQPYIQQPYVQHPQFQQQVPPQVQQLMPQGQQVQIQGQQFQQGQQQVVQGQQFSQQPIGQQQVQSSTIVTQNSSAAPIGSSSSAASVSAIGALGGSAPSQNLAAPAQANSGAPASGSAVANVPATSGPATGNAAPATGNAAQAPAASAEQNATESALQALMGDTAPAAQPVTAAPGAAPVGEFSATLTNGTSIRLSLRADGSFNWVATKGDKVSTFQGTFAFGGSSLTLNRSSDSQKLEGALALTASGFKLQLGGQNAEGLNFVRA